MRNVSGRMGVLPAGTNRSSISSGEVRAFPRGGARILICGLSASLLGVERHVGAPLSSRRSRVLKSLGALGWVEFHAAASPAVNKSNAGPAGSAASDPATMAAVMQRPPTHSSFRFIVDLD